ncbi:hypothetical protein [Alkalibacterium sp. 20]|uniref:hypothetical protein n=1 Tax=Alkalibacterium sp. 20 TaxID=1798803 RepID=UPI0009000E98|nr:hypothetical protein [Alkalibacterium sp. 20]OJF91405.1 hypothetical protein AX762_11055 [Alkalibacterium sp. 20]
MKTPNQMTMREIQELKKQLQLKEKKIASLTDIIDELAERGLEVMEKIVHLSDYEGLKSENELLSDALKEEQKQRQEEIIEYLKR